MAGQIVITKSGKRGRTDKGDLFQMVKVAEDRDPRIPPHEHKTIYKQMIKVKTDEGENLLCDPNSLKFIGFWD